MATVVLVTGDLEVREVLVRILAEHGTSAVVARDAVEAIARIGGMEQRADVVLVDRRLARGAEADLLDCIRSRARLDDVPIVLFTAPLCAGDELRDSFDVGLLLAIVGAICEE